jgi:Ca2+-binding EF-hand superfamily protein
MSKADVKKFFSCSNHEVEVIMDMLDLDGSGTIESYEFMCAMAMLSHGSLDDKAELIFALYDKDKSGLLEQKEATDLFNQSMASLNAMDAKGRPDKAAIEKKVADLWKSIDKDGNKKVSLQEFKNYLKTDREILGVLCNMEVTDKEELGTDFGAGDQAVPTLDADLENECNPPGLQKSDKDAAAKDGLFNLDEDLEEGDQFMATNPSAGTIAAQAPSGYKASQKDSAAPDANLELEYIYGYRCHDVRNNLRYTADGSKLIWHAAAVGIVLDKQTNTQTFFRSHNDDIHCLAVHPDPSKHIVATG